MNQGNQTLSKLDKDYKKKLEGKKSYTDRLTDDQIEDLLEDYTQVEDISKVALGVHLRYFRVEKGQKKFRTGGFLFKNSGLPKYVMLSNNKTVWSVQIKGTTFFRKMTNQEIKNDYEDDLDEMEKKIQALTTLAKKLKTENDRLKKENAVLKKKLGQ